MNLVRKILPFMLMLSMSCTATNEEAMKILGVRHTQNIVYLGDYRTTRVTAKFLMRNLYDYAESKEYIEKGYRGEIPFEVMTRILRDADSIERDKVLTFDEISKMLGYCVTDE